MVPERGHEGIVLLIEHEGILLALVSTKGADPTQVHIVGSSSLGTRRHTLLLLIGFILLLNNSFLIQSFGYLLLNTRIAHEFRMLPLILLYDLVYEH